ncbi:hypothetical protein HRI_002702500 [Hibiscus trionum]|uniref:Uncharacterized protein n=1 Tax=Hibiscus trionum TaxID=183268 RepID=A0A9W7M575_HIBTR|nr:hypothetical protein HRI_002702500 [Hibiscus trionum]
MSTTEEVEHSSLLRTFDLPQDGPFTKDKTIRSSTPLTEGKSLLLWSTCVTAMAVGLFMTKPPFTAENGGLSFEKTGLTLTLVI